MDLKLMADICDAFGPSGFEDDVVKVIMDNVKDYSMKKDHMQNLYINHDENATKPVVMLDAHTDEVGFMVHSVLANGLIKIVPLGGWVSTNVPAHLFMIKNSKGELHRAVSTSKPPHFTSPEEMKKPIDVYNDVQLDLGVKSRDEVFKVFGIQVGDPVMPEVYFDYNEKTGILFGKAFDCRLGVYSVIETMNKLKGKDLPVHVTGALTSQEEVGLRGANVTAKVVKPDYAIIFEGSPADDLYFDKNTAQCVLGAGAQIRHRDGSMVANPKFIKFTKEISEKYNIKTQYTVRTAGGTNAGAIHLQNSGCPCLVISVPSRYIHTHYCYADIEDVKACVELATAIIENMTQEKLKEIFEV